MDDKQLNDNDLKLKWKGKREILDDGKDEN
ncbi:MAG: hypothetical protein ACJAU9_001391 [Lentimonas sp.]|jgi:hypothetical protein